MVFKPRPSLPDSAAEPDGRAFPADLYAASAGPLSADASAVLKSDGKYAGICLINQVHFPAECV